MVESLLKAQTALRIKSPLIILQPKCERNMREQVTSCNTSRRCCLTKRCSKALEFGHNTHSFRDIVRGVASGYAVLAHGKILLGDRNLWVPKHESLAYFLAAGDLSEIKSIDETLGKWAKQIDAQFISLSGRKGWVKALADLDYKVAHVTMYKEVKWARQGKALVKAEARIGVLVVWKLAVLCSHWAAGFISSQCKCIRLLIPRVFIIQAIDCLIAWHQVFKAIIALA